MSRQMTAPAATDQARFHIGARVTEAPRVLQRACACGTHTPGGPCGACHDRGESSRPGTAAVQAAPPIVDTVLGSPGQPLGAATRAFMEPRFGHDFSGIRVHTDARASDSARAVGARAYTVGRDIVFASGQYSPASDAGLRLLAHELTHSLQQGPASPHVAGKLEVTGPADASEREADAVADIVAGGGSVPAVRSTPVAVQRQPDSRILTGRLRPPPAPLVVPPGSIPETYVLPAPPDIQLQTPPIGAPRERRPDVLPGRLERPTPTIIKPVPRCTPERALTWADFAVGVPGGGFGAITRAPVVEEDVQGNRMFRVIMDHAGSKVLAKIPVAADRTKNGCAADVAQCRQQFSGGGFGSFRRTPPAACAAAVFTKSTATNAGECETTIGVDCDHDAVGEAARLLRHEQGHFDLTCKLVGRADDALAAGRPYATVRQWLTDRNNEQQAQYEGDALNGCVASEQAKWEAAIAAGLPAVSGP